MMTARRRVRSIARRFVAVLDGQDLVEYALLTAVVAVGAIAALNGFQNVIANAWTVLANSLAGGS